jgi:hypothetical protein
MIDKSKMTDVMGKLLTQSLFLELGYNASAIYTLKDSDYVYGGKTFPSIKRLYLESEDPTEYEFATQHLCGWKHWQRLCANKVIRAHIDEWREELEIKLRSRAIRQAIKQAEEGTFQAAKWVADRGWATRAAGRPTNAEVERETKIQARIADEYQEDVVRLLRTK